MLLKAVCVFHQIKKKLCALFLQIYFCYTFWFISFWDSNDLYVRSFCIVPQTTQHLLVFLIFSLFLDWLIFIDISSSSMIASFLITNILLTTLCEFGIFFICLWENWCNRKGFTITRSIILLKKKRMYYFESNSISFLKDILRNIEFLLNIRILSAQKPNIICFFISFFFPLQKSVVNVTATPLKISFCFTWILKDFFLWSILQFIIRYINIFFLIYILFGIYRPSWIYLMPFISSRKFSDIISSNASAIFSLVPFCNSS